jgi:plastocyanin
VVRRSAWLAGIVALALALGACASATAPSPSVPAGSPGDPAACAVTSNSGDIAVEIRDFAFSPATISAKVGQVIAFTNGDASPHDAGLIKGDCITPILNQHEVGGLVFSEPGIYPFHCSIHPQMTGTIEVTG